MINKFNNFTVFVFIKFRSTFKRKEVGWNVQYLYLDILWSSKFKTWPNGMHTTQINFNSSLFKNIINLLCNFNRISFQVWHICTPIHSLNLFVTGCFTILTWYNFNNVSPMKFCDRLWQEGIDPKSLSFGKNIQKHVVKISWCLCYIFKGSKYLIIWYHLSNIILI